MDLQRSHRKMVGYPVTDPIDDLEDWIEEEASIIPVREPDGYINAYERNGWPALGKAFDSREIADRALEIAKQYERPQFRVVVYLK